MKYAEIINKLIEWGKENVPEFEENELSDGWHTFNDLYEFRKLYNATLFNEWAKRRDRHGNPIYEVHKSIRHNDGELCFGGGWFIVAAILPTGQISNHYKLSEWDLFQIPEVEKAIYPFDGHTPQDVMSRLLALIPPLQLEKAEGDCYCHCQNRTSLMDRNGNCGDCGGEIKRTEGGGE